MRSVAASPKEFWRDNYDSEMGAMMDGKRKRQTHTRSIHRGSRGTLGTIYRIFPVRLQVRVLDQVVAAVAGDFPAVLRNRSSNATPAQCSRCLGHEAYLRRNSRGIAGSERRETGGAGDYRRRTVDIVAHRNAGDRSRAGEA